MEIDRTTREAQAFRRVYQAVVDKAPYAPNLDELLIQKASSPGRRRRTLPPWVVFTAAAAAVLFIFGPWGLFVAERTSDLGSLEPRFNHVAAWTGEELLFYGGVSAQTDGPALTTGVALNPETGSVRELAPSPVELDWWPNMRSVWTGEALLVVGRSPFEEGRADEVLVLSYSPSDDTWTVSPPLPSDRGRGAVVWTGSEIILAGGELNRPDDTAWGYDPDRRSWRQLPDPGIPPVEGMEGVWTGKEAIFVGGYSLQEPSPALAYDPAADSWRHLTSLPWRPLNRHQLVWTGTHVIVYSGHTGPQHQSTMLLYNPATDTWTESTPMPITPRELLAGAWTGTELIIWGGHATYGEPDEQGQVTYGDGAIYDPAVDSWRAMPPSPLSPRCDHSGTWTGETFIVFGGLTNCLEPSGPADSRAAVYHPGTNQWRELSTSRQ